MPKAGIYQQTSGKWIAQVNLGGKRRSKTFEKKDDASRWARQQEAAIDKHGADRVAAADGVEAWLSETGAGASCSKLGAVAHTSTSSAAPGSPT